MSLLFFRQLLLYHHPDLHNFLESAGISPLLYAVPWLHDICREPLPVRLARNMQKYGLLFVNLGQEFGIASKMLVGHFWMFGVPVVVGGDVGLKYRRTNHKGVLGEVLAKRRALEAKNES